jgi:hypothetical protein
MQGVQGTMALGTVCAIELKDDEGGELNTTSLSRREGVMCESIS